MASLGRAGHFLLQKNRVPQWSGLLALSRSKGHFNHEFKPGPYPETEAERRAAAKKYNMVYEDYKPYDKENITMTELPLGDYPKLEAFGEWSRDPFGNYELPSYKRNYGEPMHINYDVFISTRYDISTKPTVSFGLQTLCLFGTIFAFVGGFFACEYYDIRVIMTTIPVRKQYPQEGVVHYTFEPAE